jgi:hypothetical protein
MSKDVRGALALYYQYELAKDGKILKTSLPRLSQSFVLAYAQVMFIKMGGINSISIQDTGNAARTVSNRTYLDAREDAGVVTNGLVVGTGTNAVALADYALQTQIAHGTGSGQLQYSASVVNLPSSDSTATTIILTRVFSNNSGGTVTVREIGAYVEGTESARKFCIIRDTTNIGVSNGAQLTLNYILKTIA